MDEISRNNIVHQFDLKLRNLISEVYKKNKIDKHKSKEIVIIKSEILNKLCRSLEEDVSISQLENEFIVELNRIINQWIISLTEYQRCEYALFFHNWIEIKIELFM